MSQRTPSRENPEPAGAPVVVERFVEEVVSRATQREPMSLGTLLPAVYEEMRVLAAYLLRGEGSARTFRPTALAHEAYLRLERSGFQARDATHLLNVAATVMRRLLVDAARARRAAKRGGGGERVALSDSIIDEGRAAIDLLDLHRALERLAAEHPRKVQVVELLYFTGLTLEEAGLAMGLNERTVRRDWQFAKAWLWQELSEGEGPRPTAPRD